MDNIPTIMHYELSGSPQGFAPTGKYNFSDVFPNNYELWITNYELTKTRTSVRLYEDWIHQMRGFSQQLRIMHYELQIIKPRRRRWENKKRDAALRRL